MSFVTVQSTDNWDRAEIDQKIAAITDQDKVFDTAAKIKGTGMGLLVGAALLTQVVLACVILLGLIFSVLNLCGIHISINQVSNWFSSIFDSLNVIHAVIGAEIATIAVLGAVIVIYDVSHRPEDEHFERAPTFKDSAKKYQAICWGAQFSKDAEDHLKFDGYRVDLLNPTTLDANGNGYANIYGAKTPENHYAISGMVALVGAPLYILVVIVYNLLRMVLAPLFIFIMWVVEQIRGQPLHENKPYKLVDVPLTFLESIWRVIKAPFFGLAYMFAAFYSLVNPLAGRELGYLIETQWNEKVKLGDGWWSRGGPSPGFKWEIIGDPERKSCGFYLTGCWAPLAKVRVENWKIVECIPDRVYERAQKSLGRLPYTVMESKEGEGAEGKIRRYFEVKEND